MLKPPHVLSVAYPFAPVGDAAVGGAEQVLTWLEAELVASGYGSTVVAREGSDVAGRLLPTRVPEGVITTEVREAVTRAHQANIDRALARGGIDLVHMHGIDFSCYKLPHSVPVLVTLHLPPSWYPPEIWSLPANYRLQCVSETQRMACPAEIRERVPVVANGVVLPDAERLPKRRGYAVMLSRICPEKNLHAGIDAARMAGVPVLLAGEAFPYEEHLRYQREEIEPRLGEGARLLGPVVGAEKTRLLARARCLLLPTLAPETSSLAAMEAMAVGTPVVAYRSGALPEVVEDGRTGFLVDDVAGMAEAIGRVDTISHEACRATAETRFPLRRMVEGYRELYDQVLPSTGVIPSASRAEVGDGSNAELRCSAIERVEELETLLPEWRDLWRADPDATPFASPEWLLPWWKHVGEGELLTIAVRDAASRLVGLLPMYVYTPGEGGERQLLLLGAGTSDYLGGLFREDAGVAPGEIVKAAFGELRKYSGRWDRGSLDQLREGSRLLRWSRDLRAEIFPGEPCSAVPVEGWERLPAKIRLNNGRYRRRAEARGRLTCAVAATPEEACAALEQMFALHAKRWLDDGVLRSPAVQAHHRESVPKLLEAGLLRMLSLRIDEQVIAVLYAMVDRTATRMYLYLIGFDPEYGDLSPGTLLLSSAFDQCEAEGVAALDLLRGGEGYKQLWGALPEATFGVRLRNAFGGVIGHPVS